MMSFSSSGSPMTPVDETRTRFTGAPTAFAVALAVARATFAIVGVAQLALPALTMIARQRPLDCFKCRSQRTTGAALTTLRVKAPAAAASGSDTMSAKSSSGFFRIPACKAAKR